MKMKQHKYFHTTLYIEKKRIRIKLIKKITPQFGNEKDKKLDAFASIATFHNVEIFFANIISRLKAQ